MAPQVFRDKPKQSSQALPNQAIFPSQAILPTQAIIPNQAILPNQAMVPSQTMADQGLLYQKLMKDAQLQAMKDAQQQMMKDVMKDAQQQAMKDVQQMMIDAKNNQMTKPNSISSIRPPRAKDQRESTRRSPDFRPRYSRDVQRRHPRHPRRPNGI